MAKKADLIKEAEDLGLSVSDSMTIADLEEAIAAAHEASNTPAEPVVDEDGEEPAETDLADKVCANCGRPATVGVGGATANRVYFCQQHYQPGAN